MTNPCLRIRPNSNRVTLVSTKTVEQSTANNSNDDWWPETACSEETDDNSWRILKLHRRVGRGLDCYHRVRDAALAWEFESDDGNKGIRSVVRPEPRRGRGFAVLPVVNDEPSRSVQQIWSGPGRRLVTFTSVKLLPSWVASRINSRLYCFNPVHVVYDVVDQRAHTGTTLYSSTAYATGKGHWLRGEERVTVALRDSGLVDVEILSFSRPAKSAMGRLVWPVIGKMQRTFFEQQMSAFERVAGQQSPSPSPDTLTTTSFIDL